MTGTSHTLSAVARDWQKRHIAFASVVVTCAEGSTPREEGATMLVAAHAVAGTIGGGRLEWDAIEHARQLLSARAERRELTVHLGPAIGQCCGGRATLSIALVDAEAIAALTASDEQAMAERQTVMIYGAGHVGRALSRALASLPFAVSLLDGRQDELDLATAPGVRLIKSNALAGLAEQAPPGAAHVVMTHSHALDSLIAATVLEQDRFAYLGIIGSRTKRNSFRRAFREMGFPSDRIARIVCPIGSMAIKDKRPEVIAILAAAEITTTLLSVR